MQNKTNKGKYIVLEGPDGLGKTTQAKKLLKELNKRKIKYQYVHEPGDTPIGIELFKACADRSLKREVLTELLVITATRYEIYTSLIKPALDRGELVIGDRNWISSLVFQGIVGGLGIECVKELTNRYIPKEYIEPDLTIFFKSSSEHRIRLLSSKTNKDQDYFDSKPESFHTRVCQAYDEVAHLCNPKKIATLDAEGTVQEVYDRLICILSENVL